MRQPAPLAMSMNSAHLAVMSLDIPRYPVPAWRLFLRMGGWVVIGNGAVFLVLTLISTLSLSLADRFETEGREVSAQVIERDITRSRESDGDTKTTYWLTLEYVTRTGAQIRKRDSVGSGIYNSVVESDVIPIVYLESDPRMIEFVPGSNRRTSRLIQGIALVPGLICLGGLWLVGGWTVSGMRARRFGDRRGASVTEIRRSSVRVNGRPRLRLVWRDDAGVSGQSLMQKTSRLAECQPGDRIEIYRGLKHSWWVGDVGERAEFAE